MLIASCRCLSLSALPRANAVALIRQASSSHSNKNTGESAAVSSPSGSVDDPNSSPMTQRPLPPDDGKVRK